MKLTEFDSPQILVDTGSDLVYFSSPHLLETPPAAGGPSYQGRSVGRGRGRGKRR